MGSIASWLVAVAAMVVIGAAGTAYYLTYRMRRDETMAGINALSGVSWRVFVRMVLDALARRGYQQAAVDQEEAAGDRDIVLEKDGKLWLLSCKHGRAYVLGRPAVNQLANDILLKNAAGGFLVTQGRIGEDARDIAPVQGIELLDGHALWSELRDSLPAEQLAAIRGKAAQRARQGVLLSWLLALVAGIAVFLLLPTPREKAEPSPTATAATPAAQPPATTAGPAGQDSQAGEQAAAGAPKALSIGEQREQLRKAVSTLPDVDRAVWSSESTLQVFLSAVNGDAFERICPLVERFDELAASRIQLTPPPGSDARVRFRQCRPY